MLSSYETYNIKPFPLLFVRKRPTNSKRRQQRIQPVAWTDESVDSEQTDGCQVIRQRVGTAHRVVQRWQQLHDNNVRQSDWEQPLASEGVPSNPGEDEDIMKARTDPVPCRKRTL